MRVHAKLVAGITSIVMVGLVVAAGPVSAATAEPAVIAQAWYWEQQRNETIPSPVGPVVVDLNNQFCPSTPGGGGGAIAGQTCAEGVLPIEVINGDYESPDKIAAVGFDMSGVPMGSTVSSFKVTFLEDKATCEPAEEDPQQTRCRNTQPVNPEGHQLQACMVHDIFGDGDARPYNEAPKFTCTDSDPRAERKEITIQNEAGVEETWFIWTFDLTAFAAEWVESFSASAIMLFPVQPPEDSEASDSFRVVLSGPKGQAGKRPGVATKISYKEPPPGSVPPPPSDDPNTDTGGDSFPTTSTSGDFGSSSTSTTSFGGDEGSTPAADSPVADASADLPTATDDDTTPTAAEGSEIESFPGYMWLAILAGLIAMSLVRSVVVEKATGHRPDGVVAQIHRMNAARRGVAAEETQSGLATAFAPIGDALSSVGKTFSNLTAKLPFRRR